MMKRSPMLPASWEVPDEFHQRVGSGVGRQRALVAEGNLLLVLHAPPSLDQDGRQARFYWRRPDGSWSSSEGGNGIVALERHLQDYSDRVNECDGMEEKATTADEYFRVLNGLAPLQRAARNLHDVLCEARKAAPSDRPLLDLRDAAYEQVRRIDLLVGHTKASVDFVMTQRVEEQARASHEMSVAAHRLNLLAAFFFPIVTLSAVLGMNVPHGLERMPAPLGFLGVMIVGLLGGLVIMSFLTRPNAD